MADVALVTGASGFVGASVARAVLARGLALRVLLRPTSVRDNINGLDCEVVLGDMRDVAAMTAAMKGVRYLFHVAADYRLWARDANQIARNNLDGVRATMEAARVSGVERIIYTSSVAALKPKPGMAVDETARHSVASAIGAYKRGKLEAERHVEALAASQGLPVVIVSPSTPIGPRDIKPTPTGRIIIEAARGRMPAYVETGLNLVHVDDVAAGHLAALERGRIGENYILGGADVPLRAMLKAIAGWAGRKPPRIRLPRRPLFPLAYMAEGLAFVTGREPFLTADGLRMARTPMYFSSAKAKAELGYTARPWQEAVQEALAWFADHGYLK